MSGTLEVERRFLVTDVRAATAGSEGRRITQGYLCRDPDRVVRVRLVQGPLEQEEAWLTVKGAPDPTTGATLCRREWEVPLSPATARDWLSLCLPHLIEKCRHSVDVGGRQWVVDVFHGANQGLVLAEVELESPDDPVHLPSWLGREVGADSRYHNSVLSARPTSQWLTSASGSSS